jgi:CDP-diacylglycerol--glycerol-3-phosphate 3-phosphatidyltransferase
MTLTFPDFLTILRFILTIPILILMVQNNLVADVTALILYIIAAISDYYDGVLARRWNQVSNFGRFFDPLADKFMVSSILILMVFEKIIDPWLLMVLINRDLIVGGVRSLASSKGLVIGASASGKWKTAVQMVSIPIVILGNHYEINLVYYFGYGLLWFTTILSLYSGLGYINSYLNFDKK